MQLPYLSPPFAPLCNTIVIETGVLRFLSRSFNGRRLDVRKGCKMFQVYPSARYLKATGRGLLLLAGWLALSPGNPAVAAYWCAPPGWAGFYPNLAAFPATWVAV